ncbi:MAG TPA: hypothetical protein VL968_10525 [Rhodocyclaceae bacterium]|nr:hypothetical protein [Rhodocyclaceae bacterium]
MNTRILPEVGDTDQQIARTIYLLSRAATVGVCRGRLRNVIRQLHQMTEMPTLPLEIRTVCLKVLDDWHQAQLESFPETVETPTAFTLTH